MLNCGEEEVVEIQESGLFFAAALSSYIHTLGEALEWVIAFA
jgi:hypothetical protein